MRHRFTFFEARPRDGFKAKPPTCLVLVGGFSFACYFLACIFGVLCHRSPYRVEVDDWHIREVIGGI
ncbi:MAG TPA: hypothetical protein PLR63_06700 [Paludibacteraceae bacterium]|nr:hypothetical protein [Paludibacteraceae bacterium]